MMGKQLVTKEDIENAVVTKTTGNIIILPKDHYLFKRGQKPIDKIKHDIVIPDEYKDIEVYVNEK